VAAAMEAVSAAVLVAVVDAATVRGADNRVGVPDPHGAAAGSPKWVLVRWDNEVDAAAALLK
jgi:hypothetical protein